MNFQQFLVGVKKNFDSETENKMENLNHVWMNPVQPT